MSDENNDQMLTDAARERRNFLRKSVYAAYATPVILSLLVERADAAQSWNPGNGHQPPNNGGNPWGSAPPPWANKKKK